MKEMKGKRHEEEKNKGVKEIRVGVQVLDAQLCPAQLAVWRVGAHLVRLSSSLAGWLASGRQYTGNCSSSFLIGCRLSDDPR